MLYVSSSPSTSLADRSKLPDKSSSNDTSDTVASTGASFTADILRLTLALDENSPSLTLNVKLSSPL